ncbi:hypothetical protein HYX13_01395 [Candidatus Woesearchaeota archaeon]|nr:hypothetical protein [Candidatus Woesearchaeota archaeon]
MAEAEKKEQKQEQKKVSRIKTKKKFWFKIIAPAVFGQKEIGESYLPSAESGVGRMVDIALKEVTGNVKDQNAYLRFKIVSAKNGMLQAELAGYHLTPSSVRRAVKKSTNRIDHYFTGRLKDGKQVIVKCLLIPLRKIQRSLRSRLQRQLQDFVREEMRNNAADAFLSAVAYGKVQQAARKKLNKLYPLRELALREIILCEKMISEKDLAAEEQGHRKSASQMSSEEDEATQEASFSEDENSLSQESSVEQDERQTIAE